MYCVKCRKVTPTTDDEFVITKNKRLLRVGKCDICGIKKTQFAKKTSGTGFPGEKHIPKYNYCGPGTRLDLRLDSNDNPKNEKFSPINRVDQACLKHDKKYRNTDLRFRHKADVDLIQDLNSIKNPTLGERVGRTIAKNAMKAKILFNI